MAAITPHRSPDTADIAEVRFTAADAVRLARVEDKLDALAGAVREMSIAMNTRFLDIEKTIDDARERIDQIERVHIRWIAGGATLGAVAAALIGIVKFVLNRG